LQWPFIFTLAAIIQARKSIPELKETLENPGLPRDNGAVIAGQD